MEKWVKQMTFIVCPFFVGSKYNAWLKAGHIRQTSSYRATILIDALRSNGRGGALWAYIFDMREYGNGWLEEQSYL